MKKIFTALILSLASATTSAAVVMQGIPPQPETQATYANYRTAPFTQWTFQNIGAPLNTVMIPRAGQVRVLNDKADAGLAALKLKDGYGENKTVEQIFADSSTDGVVVLKGDNILFERYYNGMSRHDQHIWFSATKSLTSTAFGILAAEHRLDLSRSPADFVPELKGSGYERVGLQDVLDHSTGIDFQENYTDPESDFLKYYGPAANMAYVPGARDAQPGKTEIYGGYDFLARFIKPDNSVEPGDVFDYNSANSDLLGWVMARISGMPAQDYFHQHIWSQIGAEHDALIAVDRAYIAVTTGGMASTTRDAALFGQLILDRGKTGGKQLIPVDWVDATLALTDKDRNKMIANKRYENSSWIAYKNMWWVINADKGEYAAVGVHGQVIYINREADVVISYFSSQEKASAADNPEFQSKLFAAQAIADYVKFSLTACGDFKNTTKTAEVSASKATIYHNGDILTMAGESPAYVEALVEKDGKIAFVGSLQIAQHKFRQAVKQDLAGKTLLPGFVDGHSHIAVGMDNISFADLNSPPAGDITTIADIVAALQQNQQQRNISNGEWVRGWGYDPDQLAEHRHPTKADLDKSFPNHPVFIHHVSGHMGVINSYALNILKIDENTPDPEGGRYVRIAGSNEPNGLVQGNAMMVLFHQFPPLDDNDKIENFKAIQQYYASHGITTAQDGFAELSYVDLLKQYDQQGLVEMDIVAQIQYLEADKLYAREGTDYKCYDGHIRISGVKVVADGSPQGKTAAMSDPYLTEVPGCEKDCKGIPYVTPEQLLDVMVEAYKRDAQVFCHANGDATIDLLLEAHSKAEKLLDKDLSEYRTVVIHSQFMRPEQLDGYKAAGFVPSFFTNHTFYWGDVHIENMGEDRAFFTSPLKAAYDKGIKFENHTDFMVTPHDQLFTVWTAVNRVSRAGKVIGPKQRVSPYIALKAITDWGAYMNFEEGIKGTLETGKYADMVVLSDNPLKVEPMAIRDIEVLKTIKQGKMIYSK